MLENTCVEMDRITSVTVLGILATFLALLKQSQADTVDVQLSGGVSPNQGYVEVKVANGDWRPLRDGSLDNEGAEVVCRQLGQRYGMIQQTTYRTSIPDFLSDKYACTGAETSLGHCTQSKGPAVPANNKYYYAGVCCSNSSAFEERVGQLTIGQCSVTWHEALSRCEGRNMTFSQLPRDVTYTGSRYWIGQFFTPWIWSDGCFEMNTSEGRQREFSNNSPQACLQFCGGFPFTQFALTGEKCRCLGPAGSMTGLIQTIPANCDAECTENNRRFKCGGSRGKYWNLFSIASQENLFYKVGNPVDPTQCALVLTEGHIHRKLQSEGCSAKHGYVCSDMRENGFVGYLPFTPIEITLPDAQFACRGEGSTLHLAGAGVITSDMITAKIHGLWVNIQRMATPILLQNVSGNISPTSCISLNITDSAKKNWIISNCDERYLYACAMLKDKPPVIEDTATSVQTSTTGWYFTLTPTPERYKDRRKGVPKWIIIAVGTGAGVVLAVAIIIVVCCIRAKRSQSPQKKSKADMQQEGYELIQKPYEETSPNNYDVIKDTEEKPEDHFYYDLEDARREAKLLNNSSQSPPSKMKVTEKISYVHPADRVKDQHQLVEERVSTTSSKYTTPYDSLPAKQT